MGLFRKRKKAKTTEQAIEEIQEEIEAINSKINAEMYAEFIVIEFIAKEFSKCEIKFYNKRELKNGEEFYRWNIKPNRFQNGIEFKKELISKLLIDSEVLIFENSKNELIIADSFNVKKNGTSEYLFTDICKENERHLSLLSSSKAIYLSYDENNLKGKLRYLLDGLQQLITDMAVTYQNSSTQKGIIQYDTLQVGGDDLDDAITKLINTKFKPFFNSKRNAVIPLFKGINYRDLNENRSSSKSNEIANIENTINEMISKSAISHGIMPSMLLGDREDTTEAEKTTISKAIKPIVDLIETGINAVLFSKTEYLNGNYAKIDMLPLRYSTIFDYAEASDKLLSTGQFSIDDIREARGERRLNTWWSKSHIMTKNYQFIELMDNQTAKGGENSD